MLCVTAAVAAGCARHPTPEDQFRSTVAPFTTARDQTLSLVGAAKSRLGALDLNTLTSSYTALEEKGNAYADFFAAVVTDSTFDDAKNERDAANLNAAIKSFNASFASIAPPGERNSRIDTGWSAQFAASVRGYWQQYQATIRNLSPQDRANVLKQLKAATVWPNYEDVAAQAATPTPH